MPTYVVGDGHLTDWSIGMQQDADFADPRHGRRREVGSNPRSRAKRTTARHCFLVPFVTTPVLPKGLTLPRPGDHSGRYAKRRSAVSVAVPEPFLFGTIVKRRWLTWWRLKRCSSRW